jgi:hypothetical protein
MTEWFPLDIWRTQFPALRPSMLGEFPDPKDLIMWIRRGDYSTYQGKKKSYLVRYEGTWPRIPAERVYLSLFVPDNLLEEIWYDLAGWTRKAKAYGVYAVLGVSYTVWEDDPLPIQAYNFWRIRFTERYLQDHGIRVIPTLDCSFQLQDFVWSTLPPSGVIPAAAVDVQISLRQSSISKMGFQQYAQEIAEHLDIDKVLFWGATSKQNKLACLRSGLGRKALFTSWGYEYREYIGKKERGMLPGVPTQRKIKYEKREQRV